MSKWEIDLIIQFEADDIDSASDMYDEICDMLSDKDCEPIEAEISRALATE